MVHNIRGPSSTNSLSNFVAMTMNVTAISSSNMNSDAGMAAVSMSNNVSSQLEESITVILA